MSFTLPPLPYKKDALVPHISAETIEYHYGKHHQAYVNKLNDLVKGTAFENVNSLEDIIKKASGGIFNNAAQIWNHSFYWQCLTPNKTHIPDALDTAITKTFGSMEQFKTAFIEKAMGNFGSGWTWLVKNTDGTLEIVNTSNANNPLTDNKKPLLTCDIWEHAYYIDYRNARAKYLEEFWRIINWTFVHDKSR
ncbi:MAG: superoxide dismutase [Gammaproteobacteria bacterium RIFCSPHIGHO2_02_FULL_42_13]|nr:MAG: superoxide dismutase [Gammaproteobacteria bacterium RIFCSPHIGHO2_02_FULL_42_13]OGT70559.1 MAG: superoxide dismutase [Gammaproteobacteria bacterium RIFCSPLOWO2_02_FULL_42_9]